MDFFKKVFDFILQSFQASVSSEFIHALIFCLVISFCVIFLINIFKGVL